MTTLSIAGMGLVSPLGMRPAEHAFFLRAEQGPPAPGAFRDEEGEPLPVAYCPWLGAHAPMSERLIGLALPALADALAPWAASRDPRARAALLVCTAAARPGLDDAHRAAVEEALSAEIPGRPARYTGEASVFKAIADAGAILEKGGAAAVVIVAVDSLVSPAQLAGWRRLSTTPWETDLPRPAECAAALLLTLPDAAKRQRLPVLATVHQAEVLLGEASDHNDAIIDGAAMTALVRRLPSLGKAIGASFGQHGVGGLRRREWEMAAARCASSFRQDCAFICVESAVGSFGASAGAANLVFGIAMERHQTWPEGAHRDEPFVAWGISPDGARGLCLATPRG